LLEGRSRQAARVVLVMDQLNTHSLASWYEAFPPHQAQRLAQRLEMHHTPKHGSWLNMAEIERRVLARDLPERVGTRSALEQRVSAWEQRRNHAGGRADGHFTTTKARINLRKLYPTIED
jgi:DDE superfamily endonuclease